MKNDPTGDIRALLIKHNTRNTKVNRNPFICESCNLSYDKEQYKILYENKKLVYFLLYPKWSNQDSKFFLCHDCLSKSAMRICQEYEIPILTVKIKDGRKWFDLDFFYDEEEGPITPEDLDLF